MYYPEKILCAAVNFKDGKKHINQPSGIEEGFVVSGYRHGDCKKFIAGILGFYSKSEDSNYVVDGFLTSHNRFVDRKEALKIALSQDQIKDTKLIDMDMGVLTSENLY